MEAVEKGISQDDELIFGAEAAAKFLPYKPSWIFQLVNLKQIPFHKRGHRLIFLKSELRAWLLENRIKTIDEIRAEAERRPTR